MKRLVPVYFIVLILLTISGWAHGQDLIVTVTGDSINCKIINIKGKAIHYAYVLNNTYRESLLPFYKIEAWQRNFYPKPEPSVVQTAKNQVYPPFRATTSGGFSYLTARVSESVPPDLRGYVKKLKTGWHFGGSIHYFSSENVGIGITYSLSRTSNRMENVYVTDTLGMTRTGVMKDNIYLHYFGPSLCSRKIFSGNKIQLFADFSFGYVIYRNDAKLINDYILQGRSWGFSGKAGIDLAINRHFSLGVYVSGTYGLLNTLEVKSSFLQQTVRLNTASENISRMETGVVFRWNK